MDFNFSGGVMNRVHITIASFLLFASPTYLSRFDIRAEGVVEKMVAGWWSQARQNSAPRVSLRSGTIEGVVVDTMDGPRAIWFIVESGGVKYQLLLWSPDRDAKVVGDNVMRIGTRVKVTYANLTKLAQSNSAAYEGEAMKVINLSRPAAPAQSSQQNGQARPLNPRRQREMEFPAQSSQQNGQMRPSISTNNSDIPPTPYEDQGACPFECCSYRRWTVKAQTVVKQDRYRSSPVAFKLRRGERVMGMTGVVITTRPGQARVLKSTVIGGLQARSGETIYLLTYLGEGFYKVWYKDKVEKAEIEGGGGFTIVREPESVWWVKVKNSKGQIGWTDQTNNFNGTDACG
jgi:hypothetical protein